MNKALWKVLILEHNVVTKNDGGIIIYTNKQSTLISYNGIKSNYLSGYSSLRSRFKDYFESLIKIV